MRKSEQTYQQFLEERHGKHQASDDMLSQITKKATGQGVNTKNRLIKGENSEVYDVVTDKEKEIIIRISRTEWNGFEAENWAIGKCKKLGLPVPEVLFTGEVFDDKETVMVSVQNKLPGLQLGEMKNLNKDTLRGITSEAGRMLSTIHSVKLTKYGDLDASGDGKFATYREYIEDRFNRVNILANSEDKTGIKSANIKKALEIIRANDGLFDQVQQSILLHNDFSPKHILVTGSEITGIIDFETVHGGYPMQELARWDYYWGEDFPLDWLIEGYEDKSLIGKDFENEIHHFRMMFCLNVASYYLETGNFPGLRHAKIELEKDLNYFG